MKTNKVNKFNLFNIKGMAMLEFIIVMSLAFVIMGIFIEIGYVLRSEAYLIATVKQTARNMAYSGKLDEAERNKLKNTLQEYNLETTYIGIQVEGTAYHESKNSDIETLMFRQDFCIKVIVNHPLRVITFRGIQPINLPLPCVVGGRSEYFNIQNNETYNPSTIYNTADWYIERRWFYETKD